MIVGICYILIEVSSLVTLEREYLQRVNVLKLQDDSTGASPRKTMRFRKSAARYKGNIKGPNVSRKSGRVNAGWYDGSVRLDISAVASLRARCRRLAGGTEVGLG